MELLGKSVTGESWGSVGPRKRRRREHTLKSLKVKDFLPFEGHSGDRTEWEVGVEKASQSQVELRVQGNDVALETGVLGD